MARRKVPKRSSCIGIVGFGTWIPFPAVPWGIASDCCVVLYVGRLSPERTRCPSEICSKMSFVFMPGISKIAVRMDSAGSSIKSMLEKKLAKEWKNLYILTYRGVYSEGVDEIGWGATALSLPDFMASMHLRFAARLTAWTKARCRNASKLLWSVIWCRELIIERMGYSDVEIFWMWSNPFIPPIGGNIRIGWTWSSCLSMMIGCDHGPRFLPNALHEFERPLRSVNFQWLVPFRCCAVEGGR